MMQLDQILDMYTAIIDPSPPLAAAGTDRVTRTRCPKVRCTPTAWRR
jgi:hypothetical protein